MTSPDRTMAAEETAASRTDADVSPSHASAATRGSPFGGRIAAALILAGAAILAVASSRIEYAFSSDPLGPKAFPALLAAALGVFGLWYLLRPGESEAAPDRGTLARSVVLIGTTAVAVAAMPAVGFVISATVMCGVCAYYFGASIMRAAVIGVAQGAFWFVTFKYLLGTYLPLGSLLFPGQ